MSRIIKFRFWSKILNHFVIPDDSIFVGALKDENMEVMQYTGLLDKNGKEIYEGDLIRLETPTMPLNDGLVQVVRFEGNGYWLCGGQRHSLIVPPSVKLEIIGNIYENSGFLEKKESEK